MTRFVASEPLYQFGDQDGRVRREQPLRCCALCDASLVEGLNRSGRSTEL